MRSQLCSALICILMPNGSIASCKDVTYSKLSIEIVSLSEIPSSSGSSSGHFWRVLELKLGS